jgi:hypothetical protein
MKSTGGSRCGAGRVAHEASNEAERMSLEIMSTEADALAVALERDLIGVDDFAPGPRW